MVLDLSSQQRKQLQEALIDAFPNTASLERMLSYQLDKNIRAIAGEGSLQDIVFNLIQAANSQGWLEDLVRAAFESNPGNRKLRDVAQELIIQPEENASNVLVSGITGQKLKTTLEVISQLSDDLRSDRNVDYTQLRNFLAAEQWKEANRETESVFKPASREEESLLISEFIENFPCTDLRTIDQLWVKYSNGHFGFSVQKRIWESVRKDYDLFGDRVGWRKGRKREWITSEELTFDTSAKEGHLPLKRRRHPEIFFSRIQACKL